MTRPPSPDILANLLDNTPAANGVVEIPLGLINDNPFQKRTDYGDLTDLACDIREHGVMSPPIARRVAGRYELAFGHRRKRACAEANLATMPLIIRPLTDEQMATMAYSENEQRIDVSPIDKANAILAMITRFGWTHQQIADKLNVSRPAVSNLLRLLRLPDDVQAAVSSGEVSTRQAEALIPLATLPAEALQRLSNSYDGLDRMMTRAKQGESSDNLRSSVTGAMLRATFVLPDHWSNYSFDDLAVQQPRCAGCQHIVQVRDEDRCSLQSCWTAKSSAWQAIEHRWIVEATGTPIAPERMEVNEYDSFYGSQRVFLDLPEIAVEPPSLQCPNLRIRKPYKGNWEFVCYHPGKASCACLRKAESDAKKSGNRGWRQIRAVVEKALTDQLAAYPLEALRLLARAYGNWEQREQILSWDAAQCITAAVSGLIKQFSPYQPEENNDKARAEMQKLLALAGLPSPWEDS